MPVFNQTLSFHSMATCPSFARTFARVCSGFNAAMVLASAPLQAYHPWVGVLLAEPVAAKQDVRAVQPPELAEPVPLAERLCERADGQVGGPEGPEQPHEAQEQRDVRVEEERSPVRALHIP